MEGAGLRHCPGEVAVVVWAPEVGHAPVVVVPEVGRTPRAYRANKVIPPLGSEISCIKWIDDTLLCYYSLLCLPVELPRHQGTRLPPVPGVQGAAAEVVMLPRAHNVSKDRNDKVSAPISYYLTLIRDTNSPCRVCFHHRSCILPENWGSHRLSSEMIFTENDSWKSFFLRPDSLFCHSARCLCKIHILC